jgi:hypothetical protein
MKKIGFVALCLVCFAVIAFAQAPVVATPAVTVPAAAAVAAPEAAVAVPVAQAITIQGRVSVVNGPDGALQAIYINPPEPEHGYKVDIVNGEGKTLADKRGKTVKATGVDANRLFTIQTITVVE